MGDYAASHMFFAATLPHEWLFPQCSCIVSHGGSGTVAASVRSGRPAIITPVFLDQFEFAQQVENLGVGVGMRQLQKITTDELAFAISRCLQDGDLQAKAAALGDKLRPQNGVGEAVSVLRAFVDGPLKSGQWLQEERKRQQTRGALPLWKRLVVDCLPCWNFQRKEPVKTQSTSLATWTLLGRATLCPTQSCQYRVNADRSLIEPLSRSS